MKNYILKFFSISILFFAIACNKSETDTLQPQPISYLVSSTFVKEYTKEEFIRLLPANQPIGALVKNGIRQYRVVYQTRNTDGTEIMASGALTVPSGISDSASMISYQHGTIFNDADAPSYFSAAGEGFTASFMASLGYIVSAPDYIGYGESKNLPHPYEHREGLATASLDMLRAAKELITKEKISWNTHVFLAGYSEGGFATLALQKKMEEKADNEFNLKASSCGAGAYNKTLSFKTLVSTKSAGVPNFNSSYIWVLLTYDRVYKLNRPLNTYFIEPYATKIQAEKHLAQISVSLDSILMPTMKKGLTEGTDTQMLSAIADNDIFDWKPLIPTKLYHGDADTYVPDFNSKTAYDAMKKRGGNVTFEPIAGGTHSSAIQQYLFGTLNFFGSMK